MPISSIAVRTLSRSPPGSTTAPCFDAVSQTSAQFCWNGVTWTMAALSVIAIPGPRYLAQVVAHQGSLAHFGTDLQVNCSHKGHSVAKRAASQFCWPERNTERQRFTVPWPHPSLSSRCHRNFNFLCSWTKLLNSVRHKKKG